MNAQPGGTSILRRILRLTWRVTKWGVALVALLLAGTAIYARVLHGRDATRWKPPGKLVDVGDGRRMHLYCTGSGTPTVVLEAGLGDFSVSSWGTIQPQLSAISRSCSYDRAGTGWSDVSPTPPGPTAMVEDLHALLARSGEPGPYLLVGHSLGGPLVRHYAARYRAEVAGLVLVDGSHEQQIDRLKGMPGWVDLVYRVIPVVHALGIDRVAVGGASGDTLAQLAGALTTSDKATTNTMQIAKGLRGFFAEVGAAPAPLGDLPLTVLTAGRMAVPGVTPEVATSIHESWVRMHKELAALSSRGRWRLADSSAHYIQKEQPGVVVDAVSEMVASLRSAAPAPTPPKGA